MCVCMYVYDREQPHAYIAYCCLPENLLQHIKHRRTCTQTEYMYIDHVSCNHKHT